MRTGKTPSENSIVVLASSVTDEDSSGVIESNIAFVDMLYGEYLERKEIHPDSLRSYQVDYFLAEFENGGFSQFVYNTRWNKDIVTDIREGLKAMGAKKYLKAFEKGAKMVEAVEKEKLIAYLDGGYFHSEDGDEEEDPVDWEKVDEAINKAGDSEDIFDLHVAWLSKLPHLVLVETEEEMLKEAQRRGAALPDRALRIAKAAAAEPRHVKLMRALCKEANQVFDRWTGSDKQFDYEGDQVIAYYFLTDEGGHHLIEQDGKAMMFRNDTKDEVCSIDAPADEVMH